MAEERLEDNIFNLVKEWVESLVTMETSSPSEHAMRGFDMLRDKIHTILWDMIDRSMPRDFMYIAMDKINNKYDWQDRIYAGEEKSAVIWDYSDRLTKEIMRFVK